VPVRYRQSPARAFRPLIREQAFGEALDPDKLEQLGRYEVRLDRNSNGCWPCCCASRKCGDSAGCRQPTPPDA